MVGVHGAAGHLARPALGDVEGPHLRGGQRQEVVPPEQRQHALVELRARHAGRQEFRRAAALRLLVLPQRLGLDERAVARLQQKRRDARRHQHAPPHQPGLPNALGRHAQRGGRGGAAQPFKAAQALFARGQNPGRHGQVAVQVAQPADAR